MTSQTTELSVLEALASSAASPAVIHLDGTDAVVLGTTGQAEVQLWVRDGVTSYAANTIAQPVTDPERVEFVLRQAIGSLITLRRQALETTASLAEQHTRTLAAIRDYAIEAHRDGDICRDGLDRFLHTFALGAYDPHVGVSYTMVGSLTVAGADEETVRSTVAQTLAPDLGAIRWVRDGSANHQATIQSVRPAQLGDGRTGFELDFLIAGQYEVDDSDSYDAENDCRRNLRPNGADIRHARVGSEGFTIEDVNSNLVY